MEKRTEQPEVPVVREPDDLAEVDPEPDEPNGRARGKRGDIRVDDDVVDVASEDSFPASDPPSYTGTTAETRRRADDS